MALVLLNLVADVTGVLSYFSINPPPLLRPQPATDQIASHGTLPVSATELVHSSDESPAEPIWIICRAPNLRDFMIAEGSISIVKTIYADLNSDGESEIGVLSESESGNMPIVHLDIVICDPTTKTWKNAIHEEVVTSPLGYGFDVEEVEITDAPSPFTLFVYSDAGVSGWETYYWVFGFQDGQMTLLLREEGIRNGLVSALPRSLVVQSVEESWAYEWDGKQFQRVDAGFIPAENSILVRYWWKDNEPFVEQEDVTLKVGQVLYLQRDRGRDDANVGVFNILMNDTGAFEWVEVIGATGVKAEAPGETTVHIRPLDAQEVVIRVVAIESSSAIASSETTQFFEVFPMFVGSAWTYNYVRLVDISLNELVTETGQFTERVVFVETGLGDTIRLFGIDQTGAIDYAYCPDDPTTIGEPDLWYVTDNDRVYQVCSRTEAYEIARSIRSEDKTGPDWLVSTPEFVLPLEVGKLWLEFTDLPPRDDTLYQWHVEAKVDVTVPAGHFENCFRILLNTNPDDTIKWICPGIGIVAREYHHHGQVNDLRVELAKYELLSSP